MHSAHKHQLVTSASTEPPAALPDYDDIDIDILDVFDGMDDETFDEAFCDDMNDELAVQRLDDLLDNVVKLHGLRVRNDIARQIANWMLTLKWTGSALRNCELDMKDAILDGDKDEY
jgi:hypothetical protein